MVILALARNATASTTLFYLQVLKPFFVRQTTFSAEDNGECSKTISFFFVCTYLHYILPMYEVWSSSLILMSWMKRYVCRPSLREVELWLSLQVAAACLKNRLANSTSYNTLNTTNRQKRAITMVDNISKLFTLLSVRDGRGRRCNERRGNNSQRLVMNAFPTGKLKRCETQHVSEFGLQLQKLPNYSRRGR